MCAPYARDAGRRTVAHPYGEHPSEEAEILGAFPTLWTDTPAAPGRAGPPDRRPLGPAGAKLQPACRCCQASHALATMSSNVRVARQPSSLSIKSTAATSAGG